MKKILVLLLALSIASATMMFTFAGCGSDKSTSSSQSSSEAKETSAEETTEAESGSQVSDDDIAAAIVAQALVDAMQESDTNAAVTSALCSASWSTYAIQANNKLVTLEDYKTMVGEDAAEAVNITLTFNEDGSMKMDAGGKSDEGTFSVSGTTVTLTSSDGSSKDAVISDTGALGLDFGDGVAAYFVQQ